MDTEFAMKYDDFMKHVCEKHNNVAICSLDIEKLKYYNFIFGYEYGNEILSCIFNKIKQCIDNLGDIYRYESRFIIVIPYENDCKEYILSIIKKIKEIFSKPVRVKDEKIMIIINIGIALYPEHSNNIEEVIKFSEIALTFAKKTYGKRWRIFKPDMYKVIYEKGKIALDIFNALENKEFILYYQPQIDAKTMKVYGVEALLRWNHPQRGLLAPGYFIDIAERTGIINSLGKFVFYESCRQLKMMQDAGFNDLRMSINISEKQLRDDTFLDYIKDAINTTKVNYKYIDLEITERSMVGSAEKNKGILTKLSDMGMRIFIDDFGTKYSAIGYLFHLPVHGIKIDKSFVDKIEVSENETKIIKNMIKLAYEAGVDIIAEGIETKEQLECLKNSKCHIIQGYYFSRPISKTEIVDFINKFDKTQLEGK